jgi:hypothetical protein
MSKEELQSIIYDVRTSAQEKGNIFSLMSCALYTMSVEAFGKLGATHLWWYIFESDENKFENIDELYEFLSDPNTINLTNDPSPLNFDEKSKQPIIEDLKKFIKHI